MRLFTRNIVLFLSLLISVSDTYATHLVGGSMSYEYKGRLPNGKFRYLLTIDMYRDCTGDVLFDKIIQVSAHHNNSNRSLFQAFPIHIVSETPVNPPNGGVDCAFQPNVCLERGFYEAMIDLDPSSSGYHLVFQRCCRNTQENLIDDIGQTYYAFIPPTSIQNSSPSFTGVPSPYICQNDLISIDNGARDPDGDSLVYSLEHPWAGGSEFDPFPQPRQTWPQIPAFDPVIYRPGHNVQSPFGVNGVCEINSRTGLTDLKAPRQGRYSIAIVVSEYRNGVLLSKVRLDIQMIVIYCPPNDVPVITPKSGKYDYEVFAGEQLCFDVDVKDPDNDNLKVTGSGDIFDLPNKPVFNNSSGGSQVTTTFCWTPTCNQVRNFPYGLSILAQDDGCPPKKRGENFNIIVKEFVGVQNITGPNQSCENDTKTYTAAGKAGSTYEWRISPPSAGQFTGNINQSSVDVKWLIPGNATLTVTEINSGNCRGIPASKIITIIASPPMPIISGKDTACEYSTNEIYSIPSTPGYTYAWKITGGSISGANNTSNISVNWGVEGSGSLSVVQTNAQGCSGDTGKFAIAIVKSRIDSLYGSPSVCPNIKGVTYEVLNANPTSVYIWSISGGIQSSGGNTPIITVDWGGPGMGYVEVTELSKFGCLSDPERLNVEINHSLRGMLPVGPDTLCEFTTGVNYKVIYTTGSTYFWSVQNGNIVQDDSSNEVIVDWGSTGIGRLAVYEISYDSIANKPCISAPVTLDVFLAPIPLDNGINGPDEICQSGVLQLYTTTGFQGSEFKWTYDGPGSIKGQGNDSVMLSLSTPGTFNISVTETSRFGCKGPTIQKSIIVHPRPVTKGIFGDSTVCYPNYAGHGYYVEGFDSSAFTWNVIGGNIDSGQGTDSIIISWSGQADNFISMYETSDFGCVGDTLKMKVFADNPSIDLHVVSVGFPKDDRMEIKWELVNAPRYNSDFTIFRRNISRWGEGDAWKNVETVDASYRVYTDRRLDTDLNPFEYMISGKNLCGDSIFSDIHRNVLITGRKAEGGYSVALEWTRYLGWTDGVRNYELYRRNGKEEYIPFEQKGWDTTAGYDDGDESYMQCYRIKSYELNGNNEESWSNDICFEFDPLLWIPNAFTGNGDNLNPTFLLKGVSIKTFSITIYDRWGEQIYYSENLKESWDGTYKGREVPSGVFVYVVKFTGADDVLEIRKGNITLLR